MEFRVGSIADLISGTNTPNKKKIIQTIVDPVKNVEPEAIVDSVEDSAKKDKKSKKLTKKNVNENTDPKIKTLKTKTKSPKAENSPLNRKRKLDDSEAENAAGETTFKKTKLSKNEQNAAGRIKNKQNKEVKNSREYKDKTLFVGNIPINIKKEKIKKLFKKYGAIDSVRIRGIPVADPKTTKKVAAIKKEFHPDRNTVYAFIRFQNAEDCKKAEAENGKLFHENHLRVHCCESDEKPDDAKAIFVGNLPFNAEDEELWNLFKTCGAISHVRIVRDGRTGMGKGFAYVNFKDSDSVQLALEMEKVTLKDRELRISLCDNLRAKKKKTGKKPRSKIRNGENSEEAPKKKFSKGKNDKKNVFSGTKFNDKNKKKKFNKASLEKKNLAKKLAAPKPQKT